MSIAVDALGNPVRFILTAGQVHDICQAEGLIAGLPFENVIADKAYDANPFRGVITASGGAAVIPSTANRTQPIPYDKHIYKERNLIERFINKIKHYRRIATRYDKTSLSYLSVLCLVGII